MPTDRQITGILIATEMWSYRTMVVEILSIATVLALVFLRVMEPQYTAFAIIAPQNTSQSEMVASGGSAIKALSALTGSFSSENSTLNEFLKVTEQPEAASHFEKNEKIIEHIFGVKWDAASRTWTERTGLSAKVSSALREIFGTGEPEPINKFLIAKYVQKNLIVSKDKASDMITISYSDRDRSFAVNFLSLIFYQADQIMRDALKRRASANIHYLQEQIEHTQQTELKYSLIQILQSQQQNYMMASSGDTYAFRYLQPPTSPVRPTWPMAWRIMAISTLASFVISLVIVIILQFLPVTFFSRIRHQRSLFGWPRG